MEYCALSNFAWIWRFNEPIILRGRVFTFMVMSADCVLEFSVCRVGWRLDLEIIDDFGTEPSNEPELFRYA